MQERETENDNKSQKILYMGGQMPCLHCGKTINLTKDLHICEEKYNTPLQWLNNQKSAKIGFKDGSIMDLKNMCVIHKDGTKTSFNDTLFDNED